MVGARPGFHRAGGVAGARLLARRPGDRAGLRGQRVDPAPLFVGDRLDAAVGGGSDDAAVVAAGQQRVAVAGGREDRAVGVGDDAPLGAGIADDDDSVGERQGRLAADESGGDRRGAGGERPQMGGQRGGRARP